MVIMAKKRKSELARRLKAMRVKRDLTQAQAAEQLGVALRTWICWENDQRNPSRSAARLLTLTFPELA